MPMSRFALVVLIAMATAGCGLLYKQPIYQGNLMEKEAVDQLRQLQELGVDHVQGYFIAPPAPAAVTEAVLTAQQLGAEPTGIARTFFLPG